MQIIGASGLRCDLILDRISVRLSDAAHCNINEKCVVVFKNSNF